MYKGNKIIITICARGGSKGIPGKNIKLLAGKPLLVYTIKAAQEFEWADRIVISTDHIKIKLVAEKYGIEVPFLRPKNLSGDSISRVDAFIHATKQAEKYYREKYDIVMDLGNMTPLRNQKDMRNVIKLLVNTPSTDSVFTVTLASRNPYFNMIELNRSNYAYLSKKAKKRVTCRQDAPIVYDMNDSIYAMWKDKLFRYKKVRVKKTRVYPMPEERSVDIDRLIDFKLTELLIKSSKKTQSELQNSVKQGRKRSAS